MIKLKPIIILFIAFFFNDVFAQMPNTLSRADKIYGLSTFWKEVDYNFIYLDKIDRDQWNQTYKKLTIEVQNTQDDYQYYRLLEKFCATLKDGHTNVVMPRAVTEKILNFSFGAYWLSLENIEGKAIVTRINLSKKNEIPIGTEIINVNGISTQIYMDKYVKPYISASTEYITEDRAIRYLFKSPIGTKYDIEMRLPSGELKSLTLTHTKTTDTEMYPPIPKNALLEFKWMDKDIAYLALNSFSYLKIDTLFIEKLPELYQAKSLIIDLRINGGGTTDIGSYILKHLTNDTLLYGSREKSRLHIPAYKAWGLYSTPQDTIGSEWHTQAYLSFRDQYYQDFDYHPDTISEDIKRIVIPTVLLIGHHTASAAEDFLIYADNQSHMTKIGTPTFGSTGQPFYFELPGGGNARVCTKKDTYRDGREFVGYGIQPDIEVIKTLRDYINNNDPELNKAVEYLKSGK